MPTDKVPNLPRKPGFSGVGTREPRQPGYQNRLSRRLRLMLALCSRGFSRRLSGLVESYVAETWFGLRSGEFLQMAPAGTLSHKASQRFWIGLHGWRFPGGVSIRLRSPVGQQHKAVLCEIIGNARTSNRKHTKTVPSGVPAKHQLRTRLSILDKESARRLEGHEPFC